MTAPAARLRAARALTLAATLIALAGCGEIARRAFAPPRATFRGVALRQFGLTGGRIDVLLRLENPNSYALTTTGAQYRLLVHDSIAVGQGSMSDTVRLAAHDSATVHLPLDVDWASLRAAGIDVLRSGTARYRILGDVNVDTPVGNYAVPLDARGEARIGLTLR